MLSFFKISLQSVSPQKTGVVCSHEMSGNKFVQHWLSDIVLPFDLGQRVSCVLSIVKER